MDRPYDQPPLLEPFLYTKSTSVSPAPPAAMLGRRLGRLGRRLERSCCLCATYFPVFFVYSLSTWSVWVTARLCTLPASSSLVATSYSDSWRGPWCAAVAVVLMVMQLWSYTVAVVTSPGSTTNDQGYSTLPLHAPQETAPTAASSLTVKSNGGLRFCKKCQARKPDRAHHCSSCRRCVLKMDHHCPWLANCIGLRNAKAFLLFLIYTTLLGLFCFAVSGSWVWNEISNEATYTDAGGGVDSAFLPVQIIIMCVVAGIIGLVVGLFTAWHILLACRGQTTIECMEKTRYQALGTSAAFAHRSSAATAVATVTNTISDSFASGGHPLSSHSSQQAHDEEQGFLFDGVEGAHDDHETNSSNGNDRRLTYDDLERYRAQKRHEAYLDYEDSEKLPHAFDLGVRRNLVHLFGPRLWLWPFPVCTTTGDGWSWTPGPKWLAARERLDKERAAQHAREHAAGWGHGPVESLPQQSPPVVVTTSAGSAPAAVTLGNSNSNNMPSRYRQSPARPLGLPSKADRVLGRNPHLSYADGAPLSNRNGLKPALHQMNEEVSMHRLSVAGRTLYGEDALLTDDDDDEDDDDGLDNTSFKEDTVPGRGAFPPPSSQQQQQHQRSQSPLRARWMPDPTSGLVRTASATGRNGLSPTIMTQADSAQHDTSVAMRGGKEEDEVD